MTRIGGEITVGEEIGVNLQNLRRPRQNRRLIFRFGNGKERVPHRPSHDGIRRKSRRRIGGAQINHLDILQLQTIGLQRRHQKVMRAGALADANLLALQIGDALVAAVRFGEHRLAFAIRGQGGT